MMQHLVPFSGNRFTYVTWCRSPSLRFTVFTSEESVQRRWKEYFEELMNEENEREKRVEGVNSVEQKVDKIRKDEVRKALKRMKSGKAVGPDDIPVEVWKCLGEAAVEFLANLFNRVLENLEKAYDRVPREELWYCMRKSGVAEKYVRVVQDMYERSRTVVRCAVGQTEEFNVEVGLHQGSALSPFLFAIVMDQLSEEVRQESPWTMMFADDIVICSESREQVEENLERWRFVLERRGMKVSRIQSNGECGKEKISARIKGKVYRTVVRPAMLYGLETVSLRKRQESELEVAELKMLRSNNGPDLQLQSGSEQAFCIFNTNSATLSSSSILLFSTLPGSTRVGYESLRECQMLLSDWDNIALMSPRANTCPIVCYSN
ncbi:hypothetical protein QTP70_008495 [Hemibagrus guttatus]|uniref:ribonuclease H n=1 Tax=Hemibagrus guttatus TaxID=175788 RepID=A0AAE0V3Q6_9TELE|nr:hypothetical protein QTP70_008495 [Hemibagrus guttatus]